MAGLDEGALADEIQGFAEHVRGDELTTLERQDTLQSIVRVIAALHDAVDDEDGDDTNDVVSDAVALVLQHVADTGNLPKPAVVLERANELAEVAGHDADLDVPGV